MNFRRWFLLACAASHAAPTRTAILDRFYHSTPTRARCSCASNPARSFSARPSTPAAKTSATSKLSTSSNSPTGPFYVEGAESCDALAVTLRKVRLNRNWGHTAYRLGLISLTADYVESIYTNHCKADLVRKGRDNASSLLKIADPPT